jgi:excisionase family DNA binding protein
VGSMEKLLTTQEVADHLGLTQRTIYTYIQSGSLRAIKIGREWRIKESELEAFINRGSGEIKDKEDQNDDKDGSCISEAHTRK